MEAFMLKALPLAAGAVMDLLLGDPHGFPHPVRLIGGLIRLLEMLLRRGVSPDDHERLLKRGAALTVLTAGITGFFVWALRAFVRLTAGRAGIIILDTLLIWQLLAARSLAAESMKVARALEAGRTEEARRAVSMIVGRDTRYLTEEGIAKAAVETVAENTSDGVVAPLFWLMLLGPCGGWVYKAVNTMDSMVGYKNERYLYFGRAAALTDDAVNYLPARISAVLMILAAAVLRFDAAGAYRIWRRDRRKHKSPNSAQTESVCAGALGIRLGGNAVYFGKTVKKPWIGDETRKTIPNDIRRADRLMLVTSFFMLAAALLFMAAMELVF